MQPEQLGPFKIGRIIGKGGMGAVYEGLHTETGETAAVKVLLGNLEDDNELRQRFETEIETLKRLRHPNIVQLFGFGEEQGLLYYVMELVNGPSLQQELKRQRLFQWYEVAKIGLEMCSALKHAHDRGIIHRDIKPANILLEQEGTIKLSDYGIAHFFGGQRLTEVNSVVGTLEYMSPEQAAANPHSPRSDLYSLGAVLYALLAGHPPFTAKTLPEILRKHLQSTPASIRTIRHDVPDGLEAILSDLLKTKPEERPANTYLAAKRFQSLLQALMGPPERILVKPMLPDTPRAVSDEPLNIPYNGGEVHDNEWKMENGELKGSNSTRSVPLVTDVYVEKKSASVSAGGIYGLKNEPDSKKISLADSFGKLGENSKVTEFLSGLQHDEQKTLTQKGIEKEERKEDNSQFSIITSPFPEVRCGEMPLDKKSAVKRGTDEPLANVRPFDEPTVDGLETGQKPVPYNVSSSAEEKSPQTSRSASSSRFISVKGKTFDDYTDSDKKDRPVMSVQVIGLSTALIFIGITVYYLLQPIPADKQFERIRQTIGENSSGEELPLTALRKEGDAIRKFLSEYPQHPMAEQVRFYQDELNLAELERRLERRQLLNDSQTNIAERAYLDAMSYIKSDPEKTIVKLKALIALFSGENQNLRATKQCVELAKRRLAKLETDDKALFVDQLQILHDRLKEAERLEKVLQPERAERIRRGIIELYRDKLWAKDAVEEAQKTLH